VTTRTCRSSSAVLGSAGVALVAALVAALPATAAAAPLRAGVGKADITPQTGYYLGGWTRADRTSHGQHTRLGTRALVLEQDGRKVALVQVDLFMVPGGLVKHIGDLTADVGFSEQNLLISASHTHSGPGGYANFPTFNTAAPSLQTATDPLSFYRLLDPKPTDRQLYTFLARQIAKAVRRANRNLGPAVAAWGSTEIHGLTANRSIEAHLADHEVLREFGQGTPELDPAGAGHPVDPEVNVLRVDKLTRRGGRRRRVPVGGFSTFPDHGTVTKSSFQYYNQDHHASALRLFESRVRSAGRVPRRQPVVNVYGNSNEGDMSAGLVRHGPAASDFVGRREAAAMLRAWRAAGRSLSRTPGLDLRWTRVCFCGQSVEGGGNVADYAMIGFPFLTGSEEERGPLFDATGKPLEGTRNPLPVPGQGHKQGIPLSSDSVPKAVPLMVVRVADRLIASTPGEPTKEVGARIEQAVGGAAGGLASRVIVSGLTNEFIQYFTTPEEYDRQHYEGGSTLYGPLSAPFLTGQLAELARRMAGGQPAQDAYPFDPTNGVPLDGEPYGSGASRGRIESQPARRIRRLAHVRFAWRGGDGGLDRPVGRSFVVVQRRIRRRWRPAASDLGLNMLWTVEAGRYQASWEVPLNARRGIYRLVIRAKRYRLRSRPFRVLAARSLKLREVPAPPGRVAVVLEYPLPVRDRDLTVRPDRAGGGAVRFLVGRRSVVVRRKRGSVFSVRAPAGKLVRVPSGGAHDRSRNFALRGIRLAP
jgi:neutral ceramidase